MASVSAWEYCEDLVTFKEREDFPKANPLKPIEKCIARDMIRASPAASFPIKDDPKVCNFWTAGDAPLNTAPWTKDCLIYQYDNACNKYQISRDGKKVISCDTGPKNCVAKPTTKKCIQEYPEKNNS